jgi:hypothetical protein
MQRSDHWPTPSAHRDFWEHHNNPYVYEYDPTDDGPEVHVIRLIRAGYTQFELDIEGI